MNLLLVSQNHVVNYFIKINNVINYLVTYFFHMEFVYNQIHTVTL